MRMIEEDNDLGAIVFAVVAFTLVVGSVLYLYRSGAETIRTAARFPVTIEKTVPKITPDQLR